MTSTFGSIFKLKPDVAIRLPVIILDDLTLSLLSWLDKDDLRTVIDSQFELYCSWAYYPGGAAAPRFEVADKRA